MKSKKKRVLIFASVLLIICAVVAVYLLLFVDRETDDNNSTSTEQSEDLRQKAITEYDNRLKKVIEEAENSSQLLSAYISKSTLALDASNNDEAVFYAVKATEVTNLQDHERFQAYMNLVNVYGEVGDFQKGLDTLTLIRQDTKVMELESSEFYVNRYEEAYRQNMLPSPINCQEPIEDGDCPIL